MNSYEPRLGELKKLTTQLDNKELITDIENFALKWNETYCLISKCCWPLAFSFYYLLFFF
jgi:hypothetical protein